MDDKQLDILLKNTLKSDYIPDYQLDLQIINKEKEKGNKRLKGLREIPVFLIVCCALLFFSVSAFAAWRLLSPRDVAMHIGDKQLSKAFDSKDAILMNESLKYGDYTITLLGTVTGRNITNFVTEGDTVSPDRTYAVVAISRTDGIPMPGTSSEEYGKTPFFVSPLIQGLDPRKYNIITMNGGYSEITKDGIMYRIIACDNVEIFADRKNYICVTNTVFYENNAFIYNEDTGEISINTKYTGMNLLFDLHLNKNKADKEAAEKYLEGINKTLYDGSTDKLTEQKKSGGTDKTVLKGEEYAKGPEAPYKLEEILDSWTFVTEQRVTPDKDGMVSYSFKDKNGGSSGGTIASNALFAKNETGYSKLVSFSKADEHTEAFLVYKEKNGDITISMYEKRD